MRVLFVTGDAARGATVAADLRQREDGLVVDVVTLVSAALAQLSTPEHDAAILDLAHPPVGAGHGLIQLVHGSAPRIPLIVVVDAERRAGADALSAGANRFVRDGSGLPAGLCDALHATRRRPGPEAQPLNVLHLTRGEPIRDATFTSRMRVETIGPAQGDTLPAPFDQGPLPFDAFAIDMSLGGLDLLGVLQEVLTRASDRAVVVLADAGDRNLAAAALRLGAQHVVAKNGAWPVRLCAALEHAVMARRDAADAASARSSETRLRQLVESLPVGVGVITHEGVLAAMNSAGLEAIGVSRLEDLMRTNVLDQVPAADRPRVEAFLQAVAHGERRRIRVRWQAGPSPREVQLAGSPFVKGAGHPELVLVTLTPAALGSGDDGRLEPPTAALSLATSETDQDSASREVSQLKTQLARVEAERLRFVARMELEVATLENALAIALGERDSDPSPRSEVLEAELQQLRTAVQEAEGAGAGNPDAQRELESLRAQVGTLEETLRREGEGYRVEIDAARRDAHETRRALHQTQASLSALRDQQLVQLEAELESERTALRDARQALDGRAGELAAVRDRLKSAEADRLSLLASHQEELSTLRVTLEAAEQARATLADGHEAALASLRTDHEQREEALATRVATLEAELATLRRDREHAATLAESRGALELEAEALRAALARAHEVVAQQEQAVDYLERTVALRTQEASRAEQQRTQLQEQLQNTTQEREALRARAHAQPPSVSRPVGPADPWEHRWFDSELVAMAVTSPDGQLIRANRTFTRLFGEAGPDVLRHLPERWIQATSSLDTLAPLATQGRLPVTEGTVALADGRKISYLQSTVIVRPPEADQPLVEQWFIDVTARRELEALQHEHHNLEAVEQVAPKFVEEIDGRLSEVHRLAREALQQADAKDPRQAAILEMVAQATRGRQVTEQFLAFSRGQRDAAAWLPLGEVLESVRPLLRRLTGESIRLTVEPTPRHLLVNAPQESLVRALLSLVAAAAEALPLGGTMTIGPPILTSTPGAPDAGWAKLTLHLSGFGQRPVRDPGALDVTLGATGASLRTTQNTEAQHIDLLLRACEQPVRTADIAADQQKQP